MAGMRGNFDSTARDQPLPPPVVAGMASMPSVVPMMVSMVVPVVTMTIIVPDRVARGTNGHSTQHGSRRIDRLDRTAVGIISRGAAGETKGSQHRQPQKIEGLFLFHRFKEFMFARYDEYS